MRAFVLTVCLMFAFATQSIAQNPQPREVISAQIEAFGAEDVEMAFSFASPTIQSIFGSPETFGQMVKNGYPMVWMPADVIFLDTRQMDTRFYQRVQIIDQAGTSHTLVYELVEIGTNWKINGVFGVMPVQPNV